MVDLLRGLIRSPIIRPSLAPLYNAFKGPGGPRSTLEDSGGFGGIREDPGGPWRIREDPGGTNST